MKKKILFIIFSFLFIFLTSCNILIYNSSGTTTSKSDIRVYNYKNSTKPITLYGRDFSVTYDSSKADTYKNKGEAVKSAMEEGKKKYSDIAKLYEDFVDGYYYLYDEYCYQGIIADTTAKDKDYDLQDEIYALILDIEVIDQEIDIAASKSKYRNSYFEGWTDAEIDEYIESLDPEATKVENDIETKMKEALSSYYGGETSGFDALKLYVSYANELAKLKDYDDYLEYAYENVYSREYSVEDTNNLKTYIDNTIIPLNEEALKNFLDFKDTSSRSDYNSFLNLYSNFYAYYLDYFDSYANKLGGDYLKSYKTYFESGNYFYSSNENDNVTAYVGNFADGTPYMFMGPDNQSSSTFIHEFGHYNATLTGGDSGSYDLAETQSQGNELLYYLYLKSSDIAKNTVINAYLNYQIYSMTDSVISGFLINEMEKEIYQNDISNITESDLYDIWDKLCDENNLSDYKDYNDWMLQVLLNYQGYYISYATSAIASLELYASALNNYDEALEKYKIIYRKHSSGSTFTSILEDAGLYSVFDKNTYDLINTIVK